MGSDDGLSPEEGFQLLGDEMRTMILRAVWRSSGEALSFSEIRKLVGSPDSGKFNYHLNKLVGHFLSKGEDGYRLTQAGREVVRAVMAGTLTRRAAMAPVGIDGQCVECDGELVARYDEYGVVECEDCGETVMWNEFPPAGLEDRPPEAVAVAFDRWTQARFGLAMEGICPNCAHEMTSDILYRHSDNVATLHRCENCKYEARVPLFGHVMSHPAVVSFYHDLDVDVTDMPYWRMQVLAREFTEQVVSTDPWQAEVTVAAEGDELALTLDARLDVVDVVEPVK